MRRLLTLSMLLLALTITGCATKPAEEPAMVLPPKPQRSEQNIPETLRDYALLLSYYEHLVQEWEAWGETVTDMVEGN
jgi:hypothetical protein